MAPRRRPGKPGLSRIDAAIDAMAPFGFPKELVRKTVKKLLKEYGGDEGWPFIEDCSYSVLIEAFLAEQDNHVEEGNDRETGAVGGNSEIFLMNASYQDRTTGYPGPSNPVFLDTPGPSGVCSESIDTASHTENTDHVDYQQPTEGGRKTGRHIVLDQGSSDEEIVNAAENMKDLSSVNLQNSPAYSPPQPPPVGSLPTRRCKPCYGWISDKDDNDYDFIDLSKHKV